jgi:hypothetical protein
MGNIDGYFLFVSEKSLAYTVQPITKKINAPAEYRSNLSFSGDGPGNSAMKLPPEARKAIGTIRLTTNRPAALSSSCHKSTDEPSLTEKNGPS